MKKLAIFVFFVCVTCHAMAMNSSEESLIKIVKPLDQLFIDPSCAVKHFFIKPHDDICQVLEQHDPKNNDLRPLLMQKLADFVVEGNPAFGIGGTLKVFNHDLKKANVFESEIIEKNDKSGVEKNTVCLFEINEKGNVYVCKKITSTSGTKICGLHKEFKELNKAQFWIVKIKDRSDVKRRLFFKSLIGAVYDNKEGKRKWTFEKNITPENIVLISALLKKYRNQKNKPVKIAQFPIAYEAFCRLPLEKRNDIYKKLGWVTLPFRRKLCDFSLTHKKGIKNLGITTGVIGGATYLGLKFLKKK